MRARHACAVLLGCLVTLTACDNEVRMSEKGFRLPDGDAQAGRDAFLALQCQQCHTIAGEELPEIPAQDQPYFELGGKVAKVKTYGDLVTSIINPSHRISPSMAKDIVSEDGESHMYIYNSHMTVQELIDIVMYLQPKYDVVVPEYHYRIYPAT